MRGRPPFDGDQLIAVLGKILLLATPQTAILAARGGDHLVEDRESLGSGAATGQPSGRDGLRPA